MALNFVAAPNLRCTRLSASDVPVGRHFASPGHTAQDMLLSVIRSCFRDATDRRSFEPRMIFRQRTQHPDGLNRAIYTGENKTRLS